MGSVIFSVTLKSVIDFYTFYIVCFSLKNIMLDKKYFMVRKGGLFFSFQSTKKNNEKYKQWYKYNIKAAINYKDHEL